MSAVRVTPFARRFFAAGLVACTALATQPVLAQQTEAITDTATDDASGDLVATSPEAEGDLSTQSVDIVVTGTRIQSSGFKAPAPTTVMGAAQIEAKGATSIAEALNDIPAFAPATSTTTAGLRPFAPGANYANLRGLGATRTLVLVDGRRVAPSVPTFGTNGANQVDLNLIPPILLQRAEVVTGGASAQWGSDAVAGVVNLILNTHFTGIKADLEAGISERGDNEQLRGALLFGTELGPRGRLVVAGEAYSNGGVGDVFTRNWGRRNVQVITNPTPAANGLPPTLILPNTTLATLTGGGIVLAGPLRGTVFEPNGGTSQFTYGEFVGNLLMVGGGIPNNSLSRNLLLTPELERYSVYSHGEYELTDSLVAFLEGSYGYNRADSNGQLYRANSINVTLDNPYLPASVLNRAVTAGVTSFRVGRVNYDVGNVRIKVSNDNFRLATGIRGELGADWSWDAYYQWGQNTYDQVQGNQVITANYNRAVDAVRAPDGTIVCRSTLINPGNGCQPFNIFGEGSPSAAALAYVRGDSINQTKYRQQVAALNINGEPFSSWAGPVALAAGVEHRRERQLSTSDPISIADGFFSQNPKPLEGSFEVTEGYVEIAVPVARDLPFLQSADINGAVRYADYSTVGGQVTWKVGATVALSDDILFRATRSRDIRAPNLFELGLQPSPVNSVVVDPFTNTQVQINQVLSGTSTLEPERADTFTAGISFSPSFASRLQASVDYYRIKLNDAITLVGPATQLALCRSSGDPFFCNNLIRNAAGVLTRVNVPYVNFGSMLTEGMDVEIAYRVPVGAGTVDLRAIGTYTFHASATNGNVTTDRVGEVGLNSTSSNPLPRFRGTFSANYELGRVRMFGQLNYISSGVYDATLVEGVDIQGGNVPDRLYTNIGVTIFADEVERYAFFLNVNNLFDVAPPDVPSLGFLQATNPAFYDVIGRDFRVGVRLRM